MDSKNGNLIRGLTFYDSTSIVICSIIGTGVFLKTSVMAQLVDSPMLVMAAWIAAGALSMAGAITYAELSAMMPKAGGTYQYLRAAYGDMPAFLYGWMYITAGAAGAAALASAFATFLGAAFPLDTIWAESVYHVFGKDMIWRFGIRQVVAVFTIIACALLNSSFVSINGRIQSFFTTIKVSGTILIVIGVFALSKDASWSNLSLSSGSTEWCGISAFGAAMLVALWAYNGWNFLPMVAGEVKNPEKNMARSIILGMIIIVVVYLAANLSYFYALPFSEIVNSNSTDYPNALPVATKAVGTFLGPSGIKIITALFIISTFGTLHSEMLSIPRIAYAMAKDGLFFKVFGHLGKRSRVPVVAVAFKATLACILACSGTFDQLTTLLIFALWIFFGLTASSIFVLRRKMPDTPRPYKTFGYPVVPFVFVCVALWLVINTIMTSPLESSIGLGLIALGVPLYYKFKAGKAGA